MPVELLITDEHIRYAEKLLLSNGNTFRDEKNERYTFIKNFETRDLQAVPGSGKTTVLLAKLLIIGKYFLPFEDGSGILVLSHTNAAINEIKSKLEKHCPHLFEYPNFIGTIQSFVDEFLAKPCGRNVLKTNISWIDSEKFSKEIIKEYEFVKWSKEYDSPQGLFLGKYFSRAIDESFDWDLTTPFYDNSITKKSISKIIDSAIKNASLKLTQKIEKINSDINTLIAGKSSKTIVFCDKKKYDSCFDNIVQKAISNLELDYINSCLIDGEGKVLIKEFTVKNEKSKKFIGLKFAFEKVLQRGVISFKYAYHLGEYYLHKYPHVTKLIRKRFQYIFVDEMQDMDKYQYDILEKLFYDKGASITFQRIGDINQSIYGKVKAENYWEDRNPLNLTGSYRLTKQVGELVNRFALYPTPNLKIEGLHICMLFPHILVYNDDTKKNLIEKYSAIIKTFQDNGTIPISTNLKYPFKAIAWNTNWKNDDEKKNDENKLRLEDFYPEYSNQSSITKESYDSLIDYLVFFNDKKKTLGAIRKNILNSIIKILDYEKRRDENKRYFTKKTLFSYIKRQDDIQQTNYYEEFNLNVYKWSIEAIKGRQHCVSLSMRLYLPIFFKNLFDISELCKESKSFLVAEHSNKIAPEITEDNSNEIVRLPNKYVDTRNNITIEIGSVHSVKGQTHTATLYLESSYYNEYESQRLTNRFLGNNFNNEKLRHKESTKMIYVGFSRPTHLLCFAIHKARFEQLKTFFEDHKNDWKVEYCD